MSFIHAIYGLNEGEGLLHWIQNELVHEFGINEDMIIFINSIPEGDELRKGSFPSVQIYPERDDYTQIGDRVFEHITQIKLIVTTKGPRIDGFMESTGLISKMYEHFMGITPRLDRITFAPVKGHLTYSWEGFRVSRHRNLELSHSTIDFQYKWRDWL